jgi:hypothetical protein
MVDKLLSLPRSRAAVLLLSVPALISGGILALAVFAPTQFAAWDYFRLTAIAIAITFPVMGVNAQLTGGAMIALMLPGMQAAAKHEAVQWAQGKKPVQRSKQMTSEAYWTSVTLATFYAIPIIYLPIVASVFTPMDVSRAIVWAAWAQVVAFVPQILMLIGCTYLGFVTAKQARSQATDDVEAGLIDVPPRAVSAGAMSAPSSVS